MKKTASLLFVVSTILCAADKTPQVTVGSGDRVISHIALGGGWTTTLTVVNLWSAPSPFQITFYDDNGLPLSVNTNSAQGVTPVYRSTVAVRASQRILISGDSTVKSGWAEVSYDWATAVVGISAVFRQSIDGRPDFEAVSPVATPYSAIRVPFDETGGYSTGLAIANPATSAETYRLTARDEQGNTLNAAPITITLQSKGHTAFALVGNADLKPFVQNQKGVIDIVAVGNKPMGVLGLRFSPTFSFTSTVPWYLTWGTYQ
jgi:hypothetical protein